MKTFFFVAGFFAGCWLTTDTIRKALNDPTTPALKKLHHTLKAALL